MKTTINTLLILSLLAAMSCGQSAEQKTGTEKTKTDSLINVGANEKAKQINSDILHKITSAVAELEDAKSELNKLTNDPDYIYCTKRLAIVRARVSTGASYGWIDKDNKFWNGNDANKAFDDAAAFEKYQLEKIKTKSSEIKALEGKVKDLRDLQPK